MTIRPRFATTWIAALLLVVPSRSSRAEDRQPGGAFQLSGALGYPAIVGLGLGARVGRGEALVHGGVFGGPGAFVVASAELLARLEVARLGRWSLLAGALGAVVHEALMPYDCIGEPPGPCGSESTTWLVGPLVTLRLHLSDHPAFGERMDLEVSGGPLITPGRELRAGLDLRAVVSF